MEELLDILGDFEINADQNTFKLLFGEARAVEMYTLWRVKMNFSATALYYSLKRDDQKRFVNFLQNERVMA